MRKIKYLFMSFIVTLGFIVPSITTKAAEEQFSDVPRDHIMADEIYQFVEKGIIHGYTDGTFGPDDSITRAQTAVMLARVLELDVPKSEEVTKYFTDVKTEEISAGEIAAVAEAGIMTGKDEKFNPHDYLNREQLASVLARGFNLQSGEDVDVYLKNVSEPHRDSVQQLANLGITDQLDDYRPIENGTRAHFVTMLARTMETIEDSKDLTELLKEVYENEMNLETYEVEGSFNFGLTLPDLTDDEDIINQVTAMLEDIQVDVEGAYQKDPMLIEANVDVTLQLDPKTKTTLSIPMVMNENKMWMKMPQVPGEELPEEVKNKFIEFDYEEILGDEPLEMDSQIEFAQALQNLFVDHFAEDYYDEVSLSDYEGSTDLDIEKVVKFNLNDDELKAFVETLFVDFFPEFIELLEDPNYAGALGLTEDEVQTLKEEFDALLEEIDQVVTMIDEMIQINAFEEYIGINDKNIIVSDDFNLDVDVTFEDETIGMILKGNQNKQNINEDVSITVPKEEDTITFEEFLKIVEAELEEHDDEALEEIEEQLIQ